MATITATELAAQLGTDSKTTRRFLRTTFEQDQHPGKGGQWAIEKKQVQSLRAKFRKWEAAEAEKKASRKTAEKIDTHPVADTPEALASEEAAVEEVLEEEVTDDADSE